MVGRIDETNYHEVKQRHLSSQCELNDFTKQQTTYVAVVSEPRGGIGRFVDEVWPELGMPEWALHKFLERRAGYRTNSAIDDAHNTAYEEVGLHGIYQDHLSNSSAARERINEAVERILSNENITLVCYERGGDSCHRHILVDVIRERVQSRQDCKFKLRA